MLLELKHIMEEEYIVLKELLEALIEQNRYLIRKEVFNLDKIVKVLEEKSKTVALWETKRRKLTKNRSMREIIAEAKDKNLETIYKDIVEILRKMEFQKDTNEALIKHGMIFTHQMLRALNPNMEAKTYNAVGRSR
ncbi:flagellar export chaperone FlgN [Clostridium sp. WILCCON 0269]|uniref:Flagellar export chaperone FlgN n=1 Tax=Candidatus Clostridium eludens TaxID=3381663 RepID=A0ABW8SQZ3_9CLOT